MHLLRYTCYLTRTITLSDRQHHLGSPNCDINANTIPGATLSGTTYQAGVR